MQRFLKYYSRKTLKLLLENLPKSNFESHCQNQTYNKPTVLFYNGIHKSPYEILELKYAKFKIESEKTGLTRIILGIFDLGYIQYQIEQSSRIGRWVVIENI